MPKFPPQSSAASKAKYGQLATTSSTHPQATLTKPAVC